MLLFELLMVLVVLGIVAVWVMHGHRPPPPAPPRDEAPMYEPGRTLPIPSLSANCIHEWQVVDRTLLEAAHEQRLVLVQRCPMCGLLDKTEAVTSRPPEEREQCRHEWEVEPGVRLHSAFEQIRSAVQKEKDRKPNGQYAEQKFKFALPEDGTPPQWMFKKAFVQVRTCRKCGEVHTVRASNYEEGDDADAG